jgi:hypothetical protein
LYSLKGDRRYLFLCSLLLRSPFIVRFPCYLIVYGVVQAFWASESKLYLMEKSPVSGVAQRLCSNIPFTSLLHVLFHRNGFRVCAPLSSSSMFIALSTCCYLVDPNNSSFYGFLDQCVIDRGFHTSGSNLTGSSIQTLQCFRCTVPARDFQ